MPYHQWAQPLRRPSTLQAPAPQAAIVNRPPTTAMFLKNRSCWTVCWSAGIAQYLWKKYDATSVKTARATAASRVR